MSAAGPTDAPVACSGAMYSGVPSVAPVEVSPLLCSSASASPKSAILGITPRSGPASPFSLERFSRMFEGLRSRWTTPHWCAAAIASARVATNPAALRGGQPSLRTRSASEPPSHHSRTT